MSAYLYPIDAQTVGDGLLESTRVFRIPGRPKSREFGLGHVLEHPGKTGIAQIRSWPRARTNCAGKGRTTQPQNSLYLYQVMEDYIIREIDRIGEMLMQIAKRLGLFLDDVPDYSLAEVKEVFGQNGCPIDLDLVLRQENPVLYLVEQEKISDNALETLIEILFHSNLDEGRKKAMLNDALAYLDNKGYFSFKLHSFQE